MSVTVSARIVANQLRQQHRTSIKMTAAQWESIHDEQSPNLRFVPNERRAWGNALVGPSFCGLDVVIVEAGGDL